MNEEEARLVDIRARLKRTMKGDFYVEKFSGPAGRRLKGHQVINPATDELVCFVPSDLQPSLPDAEFFALANGDMTYLLDLLEQRNKLIDIMRQDGTPAQDLARREQKEKMIRWLFTRADKIKEEGRKYFGSSTWVDVCTEAHSLQRAAEDIEQET